MGRNRNNKWSEPNSSLSTTVPNSIYLQLERISDESELRIAQLVRSLILRGLAAYHRDGKLSHEPDQNLVEVKRLLNPDGNSSLVEVVTNKQ